MSILLKSNIDHDAESFDSLAALYNHTKEIVFDEIIIDMRETEWFAADMCAVFGAILHSLGNRLNEAKLININPAVEEILSKNGFLSHYGVEQIPDEWHTTISYKRFDITDERHFANYIDSEFINRSEIPEMSDILLKKFRESIFEIYSNAVLHSQTDMGVFSCGQFFPKQERLIFTVADLGVGIRTNINNYTDQELSAEEAIIWATKEGNSTKPNGLPGGLGLKLLRDFIDLNGGRILIVSDTGYWQSKYSEVQTKSIEYPFPGTVVSVEINTADLNTYTLETELNSEDIF